MNKIEIKNPDGGSFAIGNNSPLVIICGPCVIESKDHALMMAEKISAVCSKVGLNLIYKSSYDKANRTSQKSFRGLGIEKGLEILSAVREKFKVPVITDVHSVDDVKLAAKDIDILQIPAFLCRQTDLLQAAGATKRIVLVKKGQFLHPQDMKYAADKIQEAGGKDVLLCERGACFGYRDLVVDFRSLMMMSNLGYPVVFDATHSVQVMGGNAGSSSGNREYVKPLARAAVAFGVNAVFLECHNNPDSAPSDGPNMIPLEQLEDLLLDLKVLHELKLNTRQ